MTYASEVLADSPWGFWLNDETSGTTLADSSGNSRPMTTTGSPTLGQAGPMPSMSSIRYTAVENYAATSATLSATAATIETWVYIPAGAAASIGRMMLVGQVNVFDGLSGGLILGIETGDLLVLQHTGGSHKVTASTAIARDEWFHVIGSIGAAGMKLRVNKVTVGTNALGTANTATALAVWQRGNLNLSGSGNDYRSETLVNLGPTSIYSTQLSDARTDAHYDASGFPPPKQATGNMTGSGAFSATVLAKIPVAASLVAAPGVFSATVTGGDPPPAVNANLHGSGAFTATAERTAWLRALPGTPSPAWTARRRWSSYGSEVDAGVMQTGGVAAGTPYRHALYMIYELPNTGSGGSNRMYRLIHTGTLSLAGATQLHVHWFLSAGSGMTSTLQQRLILDGVVYSPAGASVLVDGIWRTTYNINPTASVTTVAMQWENQQSPMGQLHFDDIQRTPPVKTAPSRDAPLTGSGAFTATSRIAGGNPNTGALLTGSGAFTATVRTGGVHVASAPLTGSGAFTATVRERPAGHIFGDVQTATGHVLDGTPSVPMPSYLLIVDPELEQTPSVLDVRVANVEPLAVVTFAIDGVDVGTETSDVQGDILALSLDVTRGVGAGSHTLTATTAGTASEATFTVASAPVSLPPAQNPDLPPVLVGGSTGPNGVYRWVLQDLAPGGIGSWVMPINPSSMANPHVRKTVAATSTTAVHGRPHVSEGATPVEWEFAGFAPDQAFQDKLLAYADLRYRFYLIDHRNRAWIVSFASVDLVPRKRKHNDLGQPTDWMADYSVRAVLYSQTPQEVTP